MRFHLSRLVVLVVSVAGCGPGAPTPPSVTSSAAASAPKGFYGFEATDIDGQNVRLDRYAGKVVLVVNVASRCGFTPQYEELEALYKKHEHDGLVILGFPSNQFGEQEPGTEAEIKTFCHTKYGVSFPMFRKIDVNGPDAHPLYVWMRKEQPGVFDKDAPGASKLYAHLQKTMPEVLGTDAVKWNFTKFLIDRTGRVTKRFESMQTPATIEPEVAKLL